MPKQVTVTLGGREYTIKEKPMGVNGQWRAKLRATSVMRVFESLDGFISDLVTTFGSIPEGGSLSDIDLGKAVGVARILPAMINGLATSVDDVTELLFEYEPKLRTERKWLEENAYDQEITNAFLEILKLVYPIMGVWGMVAGLRGQQTPTNSPSPNGTSGLPASGPKKKASTSS